MQKYPLPSTALANKVYLMTLEEREKNREYQRRWRAKHFLFHNEIIKIMVQFQALPELLDKMENPKLAKKIRKAVQLLEED